MQHDRIGRALNGDTFKPPNCTFNAQKNGQRELVRRKGRLFLISNTAIDWKMQKNFVPLALKVQLSFLFDIR